LTWIEWRLVRSFYLRIILKTRKLNDSKQIFHIYYVPTTVLDTAVNKQTTFLPSCSSILSVLKWSLGRKDHCIGSLFQVKLFFKAMQNE
jgi:hypothetical protein